MFRLFKYWYQWRENRRNLRLSRAIASLDVNLVRRLLAEGASPNAWMETRLTHAGLSRADLRSLHPRCRARALDFVLDRMSRHAAPLTQLQAKTDSIARLLLEHGATLEHQGVPLGSLALIQMRDLELLKLVCKNEPLWAHGFIWFRVVDGHPRVVREDYQRHCQAVGWPEGAEFLAHERAAAHSHAIHEQIEKATLAAPSQSRRPIRL